MDAGRCLAAATRWTVPVQEIRVAEGVVTAAKAVGIEVPVVIRLEGTNVERARELLAVMGLEQRVDEYARNLPYGDQRRLVDVRWRVAEQREQRRRHMAEAELAGRSLTLSDVQKAVIDGALLRVRPIMMTVASIVAGLLPIMLGSGTGSEVMRRIAAPMVGGMISATVLTLALIPAVFLLWQRRSLRVEEVSSR